MRFFKVLLLVTVTFGSIQMLSASHKKENKGNELIIASYSFNAKQPSYFSLAGSKEHVQRGLTIIHFNSPTLFEHRTFDTYGSADALKEALGVLQKLIKDNAAFAIMAHDSAAGSFYKKIVESTELELIQLKTLRGRQAYVMHNINNQQFEESDDNSVTLTINLPANLKDETVYFPRITYDFEPSIDRFIAHAGGAVDGHAYTNTKNALDQNYAKGFRLFELDIIKTSDGHYVAAHDWNMWSRFTEYPGELPPSLEEFKKHTIYGDYITMDMKGINDWFAAHPDALLITDKISNPLEFAEQFYDKDKLIMELFSLMSIELASNHGIKTMISQKPLLAIKGDKIRFLKANNVTYAAVSRRIIEQKKKLMLKLRDNGIKVYVFNVNFDEGKDEKYVYDYELGLVYGMYADNWAFDEKPSDD